MGILTISHDENGTIIEGTTRSLDDRGLGEVFRPHGFAFDEQRKTWVLRDSVGIEFRPEPVDRVIAALERVNRTAVVGDTNNDNCNPVPDAIREREQRLQQFYGGEPADEVAFNKHRLEYIVEKLGTARTRFEKACHAAISDVPSVDSTALIDGASVVERLRLGAHVSVAGPTGDPLPPVFVRFRERDRVEIGEAWQTKFTLALHDADLFEVVCPDSFRYLGNKKPSPPITFVGEGIEYSPLALTEARDELEQWQAELVYGFTIRGFKLWGSDHFKDGDVVSKTGTSGVLVASEGSIRTDGLRPKKIVAGKTGMRVGGFISTTPWPYKSVDSLKRNDPTTGGSIVMVEPPSLPKWIKELVNRHWRRNGYDGFSFDGIAASRAPIAIDKPAIPNLQAKTPPKKVVEEVPSFGLFDPEPVAVTPEPEAPTPTPAPAVATTDAASVESRLKEARLQLGDFMITMAAQLRASGNERGADDFLPLIGTTENLRNLLRSGKQVRVFVPSQGSSDAIDHGTRIIGAVTPTEFTIVNGRRPLKFSIPLDSDRLLLEGPDTITLRNAGRDVTLTLIRPDALLTTEDREQLDTLRSEVRSLEATIVTMIDNGEFVPSDPAEMQPLVDRHRLIREPAPVVAVVAATDATELVATDASSPAATPRPSGISDRQTYPRVASAN